MPISVSAASWNRKLLPQWHFRTLMLSLIWVRDIIVIVEYCYLIVICWIEMTLASFDEMRWAGRNKNLARRDEKKIKFSGMNLVVHGIIKNVFHLRAVTYSPTPALTTIIIVYLASDKRLQFPSFFYIYPQTFHFSLLLPCGFLTGSTLIPFSWKDW